MKEIVQKSAMKPNYLKLTRYTPQTSKKPRNLYKWLGGINIQTPQFIGIKAYEKTAGQKYAYGNGGLNGDRMSRALQDNDFYDNVQVLCRKKEVMVTVEVPGSGKGKVGHVALLTGEFYDESKKKTIQNEKLILKHCRQKKESIKKCYYKHLKLFQSGGSNGWGASTLGRSFDWGFRKKRWRFVVVRRQ